MCKCTTLLVLLALTSTLGPAAHAGDRLRVLSDPREARITVRQLLNHTSGICPEATGANNQGPWEHVLGHDGDLYAPVQERGEGR